jgi:hypothetical protein
VAAFIAVFSVAVPCRAMDFKRCGNLYEEMVSLATRYTRGDKVPGNPMGKAFVKEGHYLRTLDIDPAKLPYKPELRPQYRTKFEFPAELSGFPQAKVRRESDVLLVSDKWSGSQGLVRLAELEDGTPVAIKTYPVNSDFVYEEAKSAQLLSDLGIGPRFHGIFRDAQGRENIVMDVVPGDFARPETVTAQTFADMETVIARLHEAGLEVPLDMQAYVTPNGRYVVIDPSSLASRIGEQDSHAELYEYQERMKLIENAKPEVATAYLEKLRAEHNDRWQKLIGYMKKRYLPDSHPEHAVAVDARIRTYLEHALAR